MFSRDKYRLIPGVDKASFPAGLPWYPHRDRFGRRACRPSEVEQHLCADKGYEGHAALKAIVSKGYISHVKRRGAEIQEIKMNPTWKARRWIVEVSHSWFNRFRKILVRYEKHEDTYMALLQMVAAIIAYRKIGIIYK